MGDVELIAPIAACPQQGRVITIAMAAARGDIVR
jgi:hypothetical protein